MAGWWEFPGGKVGEGETDAAAVVRELREELGVESEARHEITMLTHEYPDRIIDLVLWRVALTGGTPRGLDGQKLEWVDCRSLSAQRLLPADLPLLPALLAISSPQVSTDGEFHGR